MSKWLAPLWIFIVGFVMLLASTVFYPAIGSATAATKAATAGYSANYWGLNWAFDSTRLVLFVVGIFGILLSVFVVWLKRR